MYHLISAGFWLTSCLLVHRIPFQSFLQRYALIAKHIKSGGHSVGEYSLWLNPFLVSFACFVFGENSDFYLLFLGLLVYSAFPSVALLVNMILSTLLSLGTFLTWCIKNKITNKICNLSR